MAKENMHHLTIELFSQYFTKQTKNNTGLCGVFVLSLQGVDGEDCATECTDFFKKNNKHYQNVYSFFWRSRYMFMLECNPHKF